MKRGFVSAAFPDITLPFQPALGFGHRRRIELACAYSSAFDAADNSCVLQHFQVPHERWQCHAVRFVQFADARPSVAELFDD